MDVFSTQFELLISILGPKNAKVDKQSCQFFLGYLTKKYFFVKLSFFITKVSDIIAEPNDDFSHDHFELQNFILAQKLTILEGSLHRWPFFLPVFFRQFLVLGVFSTQFFPLNSILGPKVTQDDKQSCQFLTVYLTKFIFCQTFSFHYLSV